jgi:hypothetical protein
MKWLHKALKLFLFAQTGPGRDLRMGRCNVSNPGMALIIESGNNGNTRFKVARMAQVWCCWAMASCLLSCTATEQV